MYRIIVFMLILSNYLTVYAATFVGPISTNDTSTFISGNTYTNNDISSTENYTLLVVGDFFTIQPGAIIDFQGSDASGGTILAYSLSSDTTITHMINYGTINAGTSNYALNFYSFNSSGLSYFTNIINDGDINGDCLLSDTESFDIINNGTITGNVTHQNENNRDKLFTNNNGTVSGTLSFLNFTGRGSSLTGTGTSNIGNIINYSTDSYTMAVSNIITSDINISATPTVTVTIDGGGESTINDFTLDTVTTSASVTIDSGSNVSMNSYSASNVNNHSLDIDDSSLTLAGNMQGMTDINSTNSTLTIAGDLSFSADGIFTIDSASTVSVNNYSVNSASSHSLVIDNTSSLTVAGDMQNMANVTNSNNSTLTISGDLSFNANSSIFTNAGTFVSSSDIIQTSGTTNTVNTGDMTLGGDYELAGSFTSLAGSSITIAEKINMSVSSLNLSDANFIIDITNQNTYGSITLDNLDFIFTGGNFSVTYSGDNNGYVPAFRAQVVYADNILFNPSNTVTPLISSSIFFDSVEVTNDNDGVYVAIVRNGYDEVAIDKAAKSFGRALEQLGSANTLSASQKEFFDFLEESTTAEELNTKLLDNSPDIEASMLSIRAERALARPIKQRLSLLSNTAYQAASIEDSNFWVRYWRRRAHQSEDFQIAAHNISGYSLTFGVENDLISANKVGIALGFMYNKLQEEIIATNKVDISSFQIAPYGTHELELIDGLNYNWIGAITLNYYVYFAKNFSNQLYEYERNDVSFSFKNSLSREKYYFNALRLVPELSLQYSYAARYSYNNDYLDDLPQQIKPSSQNIVTLGLGFELSLPWVVGQTYTEPMAYAYYNYDLAGSKQKYVATFELGPSYAGSISYPKDYWDIGFGFKFYIGDSFSLEFIYDYVLQTNFDANNFLVSARYNF